MNAEYSTDFSSEQIYSLLTDAHFLVERSISVGEKKASAEVFDEGDHTLVKLHIERELVLPSFLKKLFSSYQVIDIEEHWLDLNSGFMGKAEYSITGQPVTISTNTIIKDDENGGSCIFVAVRAKANIPLISKKVEQFICENFIDGSNAAFEYLNTHLKNA